ncbi:MAG TPA: hypothetical protein VJT33_04005 [bacterium]|nr:hypothetical protein [bacterium]
MRRIVRDYIVAAVDRAKPDLERLIAGPLECPEVVPLIFADPVAAIREIRSLQIALRLPADYPAVDFAVAVHDTITAQTPHRGVDQGMRTVAVDVQVDAVGTAAARGYDLAPRRALLNAWWG